MGIENRIAGAPISWGVCEVPDWGHLMSPDRVFEEMRQIGLTATEAGPDDFLPWNHGNVAGYLADKGLGLVGGFVPTVLHRDPETALAAVHRAAQRFTDAGGNVVVLAAATGQVGYDERPELSRAEWNILCRTLNEAVTVGSEYGATVVLHPHMGTVVENSDEVWRVLHNTQISLCIDTGHLLIGGVDPYELVRQATSRVGHVHFKDVDASTAARVQSGEISYTTAIKQGLYRPLGKGDVEVDGIVATLESHGYSGWYVLEQDLVLSSEPSSGEGPILDVIESRDFLVSSPTRA
ncbi:TIM barrel protein [Streptomyces sp. NPDC060085]|uniref:TIM barrel protein n=1 Tax=Streptomyces sp. NPDC060085 TaxID=3347054 RepID=UPI00365DD5F0